MIITVVDLEMNAPSKAIIQIGAVTMDLKTGKVLDKFNRFVNPDEPIDDFISHLTGITQTEVTLAGLPLKVALREFWAWSTARSRRITAWGDDVNMLVKQSEALGISVPMLSVFDTMSVIEAARCAFPSAKVTGGLKNTLQLFGIPFPGRHHNAVDDSHAAGLAIYHVVKSMRAFNEVKDVVWDTL